LNDKNKLITIYTIAIVIFLVVIMSAYLSINKAPIYKVNTTLKAVNYDNNVIYPFEYLNFTLKVKNTGNLKLSNVPVIIYLNGSEFKSFKMTLSPNATGVVNFSYSFPAPGLDNFTAVVDPAHFISFGKGSILSAERAFNVSKFQSPELYVSIPNQNITSTYYYSLTPKGIGLSDVLGSNYNLSYFENLFGPAYPVVSNAITELALPINTENGAEAKYKNGSVISSIWISGNITYQDINTMILKQGLSFSSVENNGINEIKFKYNNTTSICSYYYEGWDKLITVYNNSLGFSCSNLLNNYTPTEITKINNTVNSSKELVDYNTKFEYTNSSYYGHSIYLNGNNIALSDFFRNSYGSFVSTIGNSNINISDFNGTCSGEVYSNNSSICSVEISPISYKSVLDNYALINSSEIGGNYIINLYSFTNATYKNLIIPNGVDLIKALNISQPYYKWKLTYNDLCKLDNSSIGCDVKSFNYSNDKVSLSINNTLNEPITIKSFDCYMPGLNSTGSYNITINGSSTGSLEGFCKSIPVPLPGHYQTYNVSIGYNYNNKTRLVNGTLYITNNYI